MNSDKERKDRVGAGRPVSTFARIERLPVLYLLLYLGIGAISLLFVTLLAAYVHTRGLSHLPAGQHPFPRYFSLSTIVLLVSSYTLSQALRLYRSDDVQTLTRCLAASLLLGGIFAGLQLLGWRELRLQGVFFTGEASGTYIYLISALHVMHLLGGMLFVLVLLVRTLHASRDAVRALVYFRNPYHFRQLRLLTHYWHFIGGLWVVLFGFFLFLY